MIKPQSPHHRPLFCSASLKTLKSDHHHCSRLRRYYGSLMQQVSSGRAANLPVSVGGSCHSHCGFVTQRCDWKAWVKQLKLLARSLRRARTFAGYLATFGKISASFISLSLAHTPATRSSADWISALFEMQNHFPQGFLSVKYLTRRRVYCCLAVKRSLVPSLWPSGSG